jgi:hypothetical protein
MLLKTLGLSPPARGLPGNPPGAGGPTGPLRRPGDLPREEIRGTPQKGPLTNEQLDDLYKRLPANPRQRAEALAELGTRIGDEARKHEVVRGLRDLIAKVAAVHVEGRREEETRRRARRVVQQGHQEGRDGDPRAGLRRGAGKARGRHVTRKEPGEHIVDGPELDSPLDKPKPVQRFAFRFEDVPSRVLPSKYFKLKLRVPTDFKPDDKKYGATRVVCQSLAVNTTNPGRPPFVIDKRIVDRGDKQGLQSMDLPAPDEPGEYVLLIYRIAAEPQPVAHFTVGK